MPRYVALLRGVNVGGNMLKMDRLRVLCDEAGLQNVATYLQSGNVVFDGVGSAADWADRLETKLIGEARLPISVIVRTAAEIKKVMAGNPFLAKKGVATARLYVTFLATRPEKIALAALQSFEAGPDQHRCVGREIYLHCTSGYGRSKLSNNFFEKLLGLKATTRNWNTVSELCAMTAR